MDATQKALSKATDKLSKCYIMAIESLNQIRQDQDN